MKKACPALWMILGVILLSSSCKSLSEDRQRDGSQLQGVSDNQYTLSLKPTNGSHYRFEVCLRSAIALSNSSERSCINAFGMAGGLEVTFTVQRLEPMNPEVQKFEGYQQSVTDLVKRRSSSAQVIIGSSAAGLLGTAYEAREGARLKSVVRKEPAIREALEAKLGVNLKDLTRQAQYARSELQQLGVTLKEIKDPLEKTKIPQKHLRPKINTESGALAKRGSILTDKFYDFFQSKATPFLRESGLSAEEVLNNPYLYQKHVDFGMILSDFLSQHSVKDLILPQHIDKFLYYWNIEAKASRLFNTQVPADLLSSIAHTDDLQKVLSQPQIHQKNQILHQLHAFFKNQGIPPAIADRIRVITVAKQAAIEVTTQVDKVNPFLLYQHPRLAKIVGRIRTARMVKGLAVFFVASGAIIGAVLEHGDTKKTPNTATPPLTKEMNQRFDVFINQSDTLISRNTNPDVKVISVNQVLAKLAYNFKSISWLSPASTINQYCLPVASKKNPSQVFPQCREVKDLSDLGLE